MLPAAGVYVSWLLLVVLSQRVPRATNLDAKEQEQDSALALAGNASHSLFCGREQFLRLDSTIISCANVTGSKGLSWPVVEGRNFESYSTNQTRPLWKAVQVAESSVNVKTQLIRPIEGL